MHLFISTFTDPCESTDQPPSTPSLFESSFHNREPFFLPGAVASDHSDSVHAWNGSWSAVSPFSSADSFQLDSPTTTGSPHSAISLASCLTVPSTTAHRVPPSPAKHKKPSKVCQWPGGCGRYSQGGTRFCIGHGGGKRCRFPGCNKSVQGSRSSLCIAHGGGKRCEQPGCEHAARGATLYCVAHGGGARCQEIGCNKSAQRPSDFCIAHGGGRRCAVPSCLTILRGGSTAKLCPRHASVEPVLSKMGILADQPTIKTVQGN